MTKKDYILFASMFNGQKPVKMDTETQETFDGRLHTWESLVRESAKTFLRDNDRFNFATFFKACGLTQ